jgi:hypothetical protein
MKRDGILIAAATLAALYTSTAPVTAQQAASAYSLSDVLVLLQGGHSTPRILNRVREDCIAFRVDAAAGELRNAGADQALLDGLQTICYRAPASRPAAAPAPRDSGYVSIEGPMPPGWTRIVNQSPPSANRQISMTPGRRNTVMITAPGWCPDVIEVTLQAGERRNWTPALRARPWVGDCDGEGERTS